MGKLLWLVIFVALVAAAAMFTKPTEQEAEAALKDQMLLALAKEELSGKSGAEQLALTLCRTSPNECYGLVRQGIETQFADNTLYVQFDVAGFDRVATCYGAFTQFVCPGGLREE